MFVKRFIFKCTNFILIILLVKGVKDYFYWRTIVLKIKCAKTVQELVLRLVIINIGLSTILSLKTGANCEGTDLIFSSFFQEKIPKLQVLEGKYIWPLFDFNFNKLICFFIYFLSDVSCHTLLLTNVCWSPQKIIQGIPPKNK